MQVNEGALGEADDCFCFSIEEIDGDDYVMQKDQVGGYRVESKKGAGAAVKEDKKKKGKNKKQQQDVDDDDEDAEGPIIEDIEYLDDVDEDGDDEDDVELDEQEQEGEVSRNVLKGGYYRFRLWIAS